MDFLQLVESSSFDRNDPPVHQQFWRFAKLARQMSVTRITYAIGAGVRAVLLELLQCTSQTCAHPSELIEMEGTCGCRQLLGLSTMQRWLRRSVRVVALSTHPAPREPRPDSECCGAFVGLSHWWRFPVSPLRRLSISLVLNHGHGERSRSQLLSKLGGTENMLILVVNILAVKLKHFGG